MGEKPTPPPGASRRLRAPVALTIAGSDSGGGAGIQADLKTFHRFGAYGTSVIVAITAQSTRGVHGVLEVPRSFVKAQLDVVLSDIGCAAAKTGMLGTAALVEEVAAALERHGRPMLVCDPVMVAKGGARLLKPDAEAVLKEKLLPLATLVTPNAMEAEALTGVKVDGLDAMRHAARILKGLGPKAVLIKGGHVEAEPGVALDLLFDGTEEYLLRAPRVADAPLHGAGCTLSAAITALLALGDELPAAVRAAKAFLRVALEAGGVPGRGRGHGCPDHRVNPPLA